MASWLNGEGRPAAFQELSTLKDAPLALVLRAHFVAGMNSLPGGRGGSMERSKALQALARAATGIPGDLALAPRLALARAEAALRKNTYRSHLAVASRIASRLGPADKRASAAWILAIFRQGEKAPVDWRKFPASQAFMAEVEVGFGAALRERVALSEWSLGRPEAGVQQLSRLALDLESRPEVGPMEVRALYMRRDLYRQSKRGASYDRALEEARRKHAGEESTLREVDRLQREYVDEQVALARKRVSDRAQMSQTLSLLVRFTQALDQGDEKERYQETLAKLYATAKKYAESVALYRLMAEASSQTPKKRRFLTDAVAVQSIPAQWPSSPPWNGQAGKGSAVEREMLLSLHTQLDELDGAAVDWWVVGHRGLLLLGAGREAEAQALWMESLERQPRGNGAAQAAGWVMTLTRKGSDWPVLETVSRLCLKHGLNPEFQKKRLNARETLGVALLEGGKKALKEGQWAYAIKKLEEYVRDYESSPTHDVGMYSLAQSYRGAGRHTEAVKVHLAFVEKHPRSTLLRQVLLEGFAWTQAMAWEENAMWFGRRFLKEFGEDPEAKPLARELGELLLGRSLYGEASSLLKRAFDSRQYTAEEKIGAAASWMEIEDRWGIRERAAEAASKVLALAGAGGGGVVQDARARALGILAKGHAEAGRLAALRKVEAQTRQLDGASPVIGDTRSRVAFLVGEVMGASLEGKGKVFSAGERDPLATMNARFAAFSAARDQYAKACESALPSWCGPAWHQVARLADQLNNRLQDLSIAATLDAGTVRAFENRKRGILAQLTQQTMEADTKAADAAARGGLPPDWARRIQWMNAGDWLIERQANDVTRTYLQFTVESGVTP
jgi:hypothetical protein